MAAVAAGCLLVCVTPAFADDAASPPEPTAPSERGADSVTPPHGSTIVPGPQPLIPRPFTLADRYLDAARRGDLELLELCIEKGVDVGVKDGFARSALLLAARDGRSLEMVRRLQSKGLAIDEPDVRGIAPLGYAAGNGQLDLLSYLLEQGAAADRQDTQGLTPLFHATLSGKTQAVARLLKADVDIDTQDRFGDTPLMGACAKGHDDIARLLVKAGADTSIKDQEGRTARERAAAGAAFCLALSDSPRDT
jgi:ankyrin repeat protein